jgi:hypothetical protein
MKQTNVSTIENRPEHSSQTTPKSKGGGDYTVGYCKPPVEYRFKPGQGGRRRGSRNKLGEDFIQALSEDFERHGAKVIERVRIEKPEAYIKVVASLLPKDFNLNVTKYDDLTDEQLIMRLRVLTEQAAPLIGRLIDQDQGEDVETGLLHQHIPEQGSQLPSQTVEAEMHVPVLLKDRLR